MKPKIWDKDNWIFLGILFYCFILAYFFPGTISQIGFLPILYFAYHSKNNALWLVLFIVFIDNPGYFFVTGMRDAIGRTPIYPLFVGGITFTDLFAFALIFKSLKVKGVIITYRRGMLVLAVLIVFLFFYTFAFTVTTNSMISFVRRFTIWIFIFSIPRLLISKQDWIMFFKLLFPFIFLIFADQMHVFIQGKPIAAIFNPQLRIYHAMKEVEEGTELASRAMSGAATLIIIYTGALIILLNKELKKQFRSGYLYILIFTPFIVVLLSATRGWFLAFTFIFIASSLVAGGQQLIKRIAPYFVILAITFFAVLSAFPLLQTQASNAWARISTLERVAQGDLTAGGTVNRWTGVVPELLVSVYENPLGYGFSAEAYELMNEHGGLVNPMIEFGVIGYAIILIFIFAIMAKLFHVHNKLHANNPYKKVLMVSFYSFMGLFIIHLTSRQIFGLNVNLQFNIITPVLFGIGNWLIIESYRYEFSKTYDP